MHLVKVSKGSILHLVKGLIAFNIIKQLNVGQCISVFVGIQHNMYMYVVIIECLISVLIPY